MYKNGYDLCIKDIKQCGLDFCVRRIDTMGTRKKWADGTKMEKEFVVGYVDCFNRIQSMIA